MGERPSRGARLAEAGHRDALQAPRRGGLPQLLGRGGAGGHERRRDRKGDPRRERRPAGEGNPALRGRPPGKVRPLGVRRPAARDEGGPRDREPGEESPRRRHPPHAERHQPRPRRSRLLSALREGRRAGAAGVRHHRNPRPAAPRALPGSDPFRRHLPLLPRAHRGHGERRRSLVGGGDSADAQAPEPPPHDVGVRAEVSAHRARRFHEHARAKQDHLRHGFSVPRDGPMRRRGAGAESCGTECSTSTSTRTPRACSSARRTRTRHERRSEMGPSVACST